MENTATRVRGAAFDAHSELVENNTEVGNEKHKKRQTKLKVLLRKGLWGVLDPRFEEKNKNESLSLRKGSASTVRLSRVSRRMPR